MSATQRSQPHYSPSTHKASMSQCHAAGATAKVEKISRSTVDEGISLEDWLYFEQRWQEYKDATRVAGLDLIYQLLDCCNPDGLRKNLVRVHRDTLASCNEYELLANIKKLAVRTENAMVARDILSKMRQDRDEPVRAYSARLKGQARVCQFTARCQCSSCPNHDACVGVDYSDIVVRDQVILGCADHEIKLDCLIEKGTIAHHSKRSRHSLRARNRENFPYSSSMGDPLQLLRSVLFENSRGECSSSKLHPHPCLPRRALTAARSAMVARETSVPTTAQHTAKSARNAESVATMLPYADSSQRPAHATGNGARICHRKGRTPQQLSFSHCVAWQTHNVSTTTR